MNKDSKKLFQVVLRGLSTSAYGGAYVIAKTPDDAYGLVQAWLDANDYGFHKERELDHVKLIAEDVEHPIVPRLFS